MAFIDALDGEGLSINGNFVDAARLLFEAPVARQRQPEAVQKNHPVDAVVADKHNGLISMMTKHVLQYLDATNQDGGQCFATWDARHVGRVKPYPQLFGPARPYLVVCEALPLPIVGVN